MQRATDSLFVTRNRAAGEARRRFPGDGPRILHFCIRTVRSRRASHGASGMANVPGSRTCVDSVPTPLPPLVCSGVVSNNQMSAEEYEKPVLNTRLHNCENKRPAMQASMANDKTYGSKRILFGPPSKPPGCVARAIMRPSFHWSALLWGNPNFLHITPSRLTTQKRLLWRGYVPKREKRRPRRL